MTTKTDIIKLAKQIEDKFALMEGEPDKDFTELMAVFTSSLEKLAFAYEEPKVSSDSLEELAALASAFDLSGDPELQAEASVIDQVLLAIASPTNAVNKISLVYDKELEELRKERRVKDLNDKYSGPKEKLHEMHGFKQIADAVDKVRRYRPLEAPLSTRYSPDRPGVSLVRITDRVYQDPTTGKIYDYASGYTTDKGNEIPGGGVDQQIPDINDHQSRSLFTTRESITSNASQNADIEKNSSK